MESFRVYQTHRYLSGSQGVGWCRERCTCVVGLLHQLDAHILQHKALYGGIHAASHHNAGLCRARHILEPHIRDGPHLHPQQQLH